MSFYKWSSDYEFGIPEIDEQHKHFLELLNRFYDGLIEQAEKDQLVALLNEAIDYSHYHFSEEEKLMQDIGYEALIDQKKMHSDIEDKIENFKDKIIMDKLVLSKAITNELKSLFDSHILIEDKKYVDLYKRVKKTS